MAKVEIKVAFRGFVLTVLLNIFSFLYYSFVLVIIHGIKIDHSLLKMLMIDSWGTVH